MRKSTFTLAEYTEISKLISEKVLSNKIEQKRIRKTIRDIGFHFQDYSPKKGYTVEDFEELIKVGKIKILERKEVYSENYSAFKDPIVKNTFVESNDIESSLITNGAFRSIGNLDNYVLNSTGFYCIRLKAGSTLPNRYQRILNERVHKLIYIGKAEGQTLKERLKQELELKGPGTFFRSIGCVLEYDPIKGHLKGKKNQNNFKFSIEDKNRIIEWLKENIEISITKHEGNFDVESKIIRKYCPLLNDSHNPMSLSELKEDKQRCRIIARG